MQLTPSARSARKKAARTCDDGGRAAPGTFENLPHRIRNLLPARVASYS